MRGIKGLFDGLQLTMTIQDSVYVVFDGYSVVQVFVPRGTSTCGLCGNNDGDNDNDVSKGRRKYQTAVELTNFADSWKIRSSVGCTAVSLLEEEESSCSADRKVEQRACRMLYQIQLKNKCVSNKDLKFLYQSCRYDACFGETPLVGYSSACYTGQAIANLCGVEDIDSMWKDKVGCGEARKEAVLSRGCPS